MTGIYKITNKINGKVYIGQSINIKTRWTKHKDFNRWGWSYKLHRAFHKYGIENFEFEVLEECNKEELNEREVFFISYYNSYETGYNLTYGGSHSAPTKLNKEQVQLIIELLQNSMLSQKEIGLRFDVSDMTISNINLGKNWFEEGMDYPIRKFNVREGKKIGKTTQVCEVCGKEKAQNLRSKCADCANKEKRIVERPSKEKLIEELQKTNFVAVGKKYGVSDNAVRKWCKKYGLSTKSKDYNMEAWHSGDCGRL